MYQDVLFSTLLNHVDSAGNRHCQKTWQVMAPLALGLPRLHYPESQSRPQAVEDKLAQLEADYNDAVAKQDCWESGSILGIFTEGHNTPIPFGQGSEHNFLEGSKEKDRTFLFFI